MPTDGFDGERHARRLAPAGVLLAAAGILVGGWGGPFLVALGLALLVLAATSPTDGVLLIGPFAVYELRAAARRGWVWLWRAVYVLLGGVALYCSVFLPRDVAPPTRTLPPVSVFTQGFFLGASGALLWYLLHLVVSVVAPVVAEEREKKRWEMLLTTDLRSREVLFGKVAGRLPGLCEPLLAVLPVLSILPLLGGVSPVLVGSVAVATVSLVFGSGAIAAFASVIMPTAEKAVGMARGLQWGYFGLTGFLLVVVIYPPAWTFPSSVGLNSPVEVRHLVAWVNAGNPFTSAGLAFGMGVGRTGSVEDDIAGIARRCAAFWVAAGGLLTLWTVARLRGQRLAGAPMANKTVDKTKPVPERPPVPDLAVTWWTQYGHLTAPQMKFFAGISWRTHLKTFLAITAVLAGCRWWEKTYPDAWPYLGKVADAAGPLGMTIWVAVVALVTLFLAAQLIARERANDTLQSLALTDLSARDIVYQKWLGALRQLVSPWWFGVCWAAAAVVTGGLWWWLAIILLVAVPLVSPCWAAVGLGFSAHASTPVKAGRNLSIAVFGGGYGLIVLAGVLVAVMPTPTAKTVMAVVLTAVAVLAQPLLGWLAFRYAVRRLGREYD